MLTEGSPRRRSPRKRDETCAKTPVMFTRHLTRLCGAVLACLALGACGGSAPADMSRPTASPSAIPSGAHVSAARLLDWPEFGLNPRRSDVSTLSSGITAANIVRLQRVTVNLPGTVDSSPVYLHGASVAGGTHGVAILTTTYGKTLALDATSGRILWTFVPPGYSRWAGSSQITTTSPLADPGGRFVYAASPNGLIHKLSLSRLDGHSPGLPDRLGGEVQRLPLPGGGEMFSAPAVWAAPSGSRQGNSTTVFVGAEHATAAYSLIGGRLHLVWQNANPGTSPVLAGGLLYVYEPSGGGIDVYRPGSGRPIAKLGGFPGHWNSPIVVDGHVVEPEGNANDHSLTGKLDLFSF